jgi:hypothetical protein
MDSLIPAYQELAKTADGNFHGTSILHHKESIRALVQSTGAKTMLDFGSGRGDAYRSPHKLHHYLGLPRAAVTLYDPAFATDGVFSTSTLPTGQFDLVVCSDVLEHVPEAEVDEFVARLFSYAKLGVWASVCCRPAKKFFADGTNLHCTVKPYDWWNDAFARANNGVMAYVLVETP